MPYKYEYTPHRDSIHGKRTFKVGPVVAAFRVALGMTQKDLADSVGTKRSYISKLEHGRCNPCLEQLDRIADALQIPLWELVKVLSENRVVEETP